MIDSPNIIETNIEMGLCASRIRHGGGFPVSRDYKDIDCRAEGCMFNKHGKCATPSWAEIGPAGKCLGFRGDNTPTRKDGD